MGTEYTEVFDIFLNKITDYRLAEKDIEDVKNQLSKFLLSAITRFNNCRKDLQDRNDSEMKFNIKLKDIEKEILAVLMVEQWLSPKIKNIRYAEQTLSSRDFRIYSQANHVNELRALQKDINREANDLMNEYSWDLNEMKELMGDKG